MANHQPLTEMKFTKFTMPMVCCFCFCQLDTKHLRKTNLTHFLQGGMCFGSTSFDLGCWCSSTLKFHGEQRSRVF